MRCDIFSGKEDTINCYIADATGFSFGDKYNLNWQRGTQVRAVKSHVRLEVIIIAVDNKIEKLNKVPFIADKDYERYGKERYWIKSLFGTIKQKLGSGLTRKIALI